MTFKKLKRNSLQKDIYNILKESIVYQQGFSPNANINISEVAKQLDVSTTPVREALKHLEGEGLVVSKDSQGYYVINPSREDVKHLFEVRINLEKLAIKQAINCITNCDIEYLEKINERLKNKNEIKKLSFKEQTKLNEKIHNFFIDKSGNPWLKQIISNLKNLFIFIRSDKKKREIEQTIKEHKNIIEALKEKNTKLAANRLEEHLRNSKKNILKNIIK